MKRLHGVAALNSINAIFREHGIRTLTLDDLGAAPSGDSTPTPPSQVNLKNRLSS